MSTDSYGVNPADLHATIGHLVKRRVTFHYDPEGRFKILLPDLKDSVVTKLAAVIPDPLEWVFIMPHIGVFTRPEMEAKWEEDRKRTEEDSAYWREWANSPG